MMLNTISNTLFTLFCGAKLRLNKPLIIAGLCLAGLGIAMNSAAAKGIRTTYITIPATEHVLYEWQEQAMVPDIYSGLFDNFRLRSIAEEAGKQAQTRYLVTKWGRHPKLVREFVNLAWDEASKRDGLDPELLIAIMQKESSLRPKVKSRYGAEGLMQVVRRWHGEKLNSKESLFDPKVNIRVGADILEEYIELANGNMDKALAKYSGNARGYANTVLKESRKLARVADRAIAAAVDAQG